MVVINYFKYKDEIRTRIIGIVDDELDFIDVGFLEEAINEIEYNFREYIMYELHMDRCIINVSQCCVKKTFYANKIIEKVYDINTNKWVTPIIRR